MKNKIRKQLFSIFASLVICFILAMLLQPVIVCGEEHSAQGKDQLVDALDAAIARVLDSGQWRTIMNSDPVVSPLVVNIADCYPRITDGDPGEEVEIYPFPENPTGLLADILDSKQIRVGDYDVNDPFVPGTFHIFDTVNPLILRAIIDELGKGYNLDPSTDPIQIVPIYLWPPSSALMFAGLNNGDFDIIGFNAALGATVSVDGVEKRRRNVARFTCTVFGTPWYIHVKDSSSYQTMDDVLKDTTADLCVGQLSSRLSGDYFKNAASITKQMTTDDLTVCSAGVSDGTYDAYLHFDPVAYSEDLRVISMQIVSGIPIWVAGDTSTSVISTTTTSTTQHCPSEVIYGDYSEETQLMRNFRDELLCKTPVGQEIIRLYYEWSPVIVKAMELDENFKKEIKEKIDEILPMIKVEIK
jgi:ABC-type amino acid transport substrate-binding protein